MVAVYPAWWALAMVFGTIPAFASIAVALDCGLDNRRFTIREVIARIRFMRKAKDESIQQTAKLFSGSNPAPLAAILALIIASIATDSIMLAAVNLSAVVPTVIAYKKGREHRQSLNITDEMTEAERTALFDSDPNSTKTLVAVMMPWVGLTVMLLAIAYSVGIWVPPSP